MWGASLILSRLSLYPIWGTWIRHLNSISSECWWWRWAGSKVTMMRMCDVTPESWHLLSRETSSSSKNFHSEILRSAYFQTLQVPPDSSAHNAMVRQGKSCLFKQWMPTTLGDKLNFTRFSALTLQSKLGHKYSTHHIDCYISSSLQREIFTVLLIYFYLIYVHFNIYLKSALY